MRGGQQSGTSRPSAWSDARARRKRYSYDDSEDDSDASADSGARSASDDERRAADGLADDDSEAEHGAGARESPLYQRHELSDSRERHALADASDQSSSLSSSSSSSSLETVSVSQHLPHAEDSDVGTAATSTHTPTSGLAAARGKRPGQPQFEGFWQVQSLDDLRPMKDPAPLFAQHRRADPAGGYVSPLKALTSYLHHTYHLVNPAFQYELAFNPRRVLTKPSKPMYNDGHDNEDSDYILYVNDYLGSEEGHRYLILDVLGQGTFGQVVKCQNMTTHEIVAVKVIKNKPAYFNQSMMEVTILETLNQHWDPDDQHNILRLRDTFIHHKHLCLVFELLSSNLYELIKQNSFRGLSTSLVRVFIAQLLDALVILRKARLIHCDLKPENILLRTLQAPSIKLVDFGSACHEEQTVYTYIQSRFYRSPEVLLGLPYTSSIDMWSLGCIAAELFLGLPIFPGTSEYNQVSRIVSMLGLPPAYMLERGRQTHEFFNVHTDAYGRSSYQLKPMDQYAREHRTQEQPSKQYFPGHTLVDIIRLAPISRRNGRSADTEKEMANRAAFTDFVAGLLNLNPLERWTPQQALQHPFITGGPFTQPWNPPTPAPAPAPAPRPAPESAPDSYARTDKPYAVAQPYAVASASHTPYMSPPGSAAHYGAPPHHTVVKSPGLAETHHMYDMGSAAAQAPPAGYLPAQHHMYAPPPPPPPPPAQVAYAAAVPPPAAGHDRDSAWAWGQDAAAMAPVAPPAAGVQTPPGSSTYGTPMYPRSQSGFAIVVHGSEPYAVAEANAMAAVPPPHVHSMSPPHMPPAYGVPYGSPRASSDAMHAAANPYGTATARYHPRHLHDNPHVVDSAVVPMYANVHAPP